jgi:glutamine cyclotransferase
MIKMQTILSDKSKPFIYFLLFLFITLSVIPGAAQIAGTGEVPVYTYLIVNSFPHDHQAYTQGLFYADGFLYESTGRHGASTLRKVDLQTGATLQWQSLSDDYFGEGITLFNDQIIQLTWQSFTGFVYDRESFVVLEEIYYNTEGWGLTNDGHRLIMSDGSPNLFFMEPGTIAEVGRIAVTANGVPVRNLNELEYVNGEILANVMPSNRIARINPENGHVTGWIDLSGILQTLKQGYAVDVMNGIAYDSENDRLFVTGKLWPKVFEIKVIPAKMSP